MKIIKIKEPKVKLYSPDEYLGKVTQKELLAFRIKMLEQKTPLSGYYIFHKKKRHNIINDGALMESWPEGLFEEVYKLSIKLRNLQIEKENENK